MKDQDILLIDPSIRNWVFLPLFFVTMLVGIGRQYINILIKSDPVPPSRSDGDAPEGAPDLVKSGRFKDLGEIRYKQTIMRVGRTRVNGNYISSDAFETRKRYFTKEKTGLLEEKTPGAVNPLMSGNTSGMMDGMKGMVINQVPWYAMMGLCNYFFSGFIIMKVPFTLPTIRFKQMLQSRIDLSTLDVSYVSSLAFYMILNWGLNGVYQLLLGGDSEMDGASMTHMQMGGMGMGGGGGMPGQGFDAGKAYAGEKQLIQIASHSFIGDDVERLLLGNKYPSSNKEALDLSNLSL